MCLSLEACGCAGGLWATPGYRGPILAVEKHPSWRISEAGGCCMLNNHRLQIRERA